MPETFRKSYHARPKSSGNFRRNNTRRKPQRRTKATIDPRRYVKAAVPVEETTFTPQHTFADFPIDKLLIENVVSRGFVSPTPVQDEAIPVALTGVDVLGLADTGTGKTAAFGLPLLDRLIKDRQARALILAPTRELAQQIETELRWMARGSGLRTVLLIGGSSMGLQLKFLQQNPRIMIGTPGRVKDHIDRKTLKIERCNVVVLDEVDRMLDMGFVNDISTILGMAASPRQSLFFSATIDKRVRELIDGFTSNPVTVSVRTGDTSQNVEQDVVAYETNSDRMEQLHDLLISTAVEKALVFDETQRSVERLSKELVARGFKADAIHGGKTQGQRTRALGKFKNNQVNILVATDVAARGIDIKDISHVINFSEPQAYDDYVHRIGRAGRAGRKGFAYTFVKLPTRN